jgi:2'-5' RNA ligase
MTALSADWEKDPERAAVQTALGGVVPVVGGKAGAALVGPVASRVSSPAAQGGLRALSEMIGGGTGNVAQDTAEKLAFEGRLPTSGEVARTGTIGVGLSAPGALTSLRRGAALPEPPTSRSAMELEPGPLVRAGGAVADEAAIRARAGRTETAEAFRVNRAADEADAQETPTVIHSNPAIDRKPVLAKTGDGRVIVENPDNKGGVSVVKDRSGEPSEHKFSSTQANLPKDLADEITAFGRRIPDSDLADNGRETTPHITLKYGLHGWDPKIAQAALAGEGPVKVRFGKVSLFQNDDADVVKVDIDSPDLHRLNRKIADAHPNTESHPTYEPHTTIAYVRPGQGRKYAGSNFLEGQTLTLDRITFSGRDGKQVEIPLTGRKTSPPAEPSQVGGEPVSPGWLNAQRRRAAELLGIDPDQVPLADEAPLQNLQTPQTRTDVGQSSTKKPKFVADAEQRLRDAVTGRTAGSGGQALVDMAIVAGHRAYRAGMDFAQWSREVMRSAGDEVRPHLRKVWNTITEHVSVGQDRRPQSSGQVLGSGPGALQGLFDRANRTPPKGSEPEPTGLRGRVFETVGAAQTLGQLGSPGFVMRNIIGHASHGAQEMVTQGVAGMLDKAASVLTGKRTVGGFRNPVEAAREVGRFVEDYKAGVRQAREAIKRGEALPGSRLKDMPDPETLTAFGRRLQKVLTYINEVPDAGNWNAHFQRSLRDQARVFRVDPRNKPLAGKSLQRVDEMIELAWAEADHAAMRDKNFASDTLRKLKETLNTASSPLTGTDKFGLGDFVVKYVQIPGAIMKRGIEYSPLGVVEAGYYATKGDQRRAVQSLSRAVTGSTTGVGVGAGLAALGILVGPDHDEGQLGQIEREEGRRGYSINMSALKRLAGGGWDDPESRRLQAGDQLVSIDWAQPWALQSSAGAAIYNLYSKGRLSAGSGAKATGEAVYNSLAKALDVFGDQSVLKNLGRYMSRATGETTTEKFVNFFKAVGLDIPSSFVPSLARQTRQVLDPYERDTRPEEPGGFSGFAEEATNRALANLPGVSQRYPTRPSVLTGQPKKTAIGDYSMPVRGLRMLSPAPFSTYTPSDVVEETARLTDAGFKVAFSMPKREGGERTSDLRRREERFADSFFSQAPKLLNHPFYRLADDETKAEALNDLAKQLRAATRKVIDEKTVDEIVDRASDRVSNRRSRGGR